MGLIVLPSSVTTSSGDWLAARIAGDEYAQTIQLGIEYDPEPPFASGSPKKAPPHIVEALRARTRARLATETAAR